MRAPITMADRQVAEVNMVHRWVSRSLKTFSFSWLFVLVPMFCLAADVNQGIRPSYSTPFDRKLNQPGLFELSNYSDSYTSIQQLFNTARAFRYVTDRSGDHWQSAEETDSKRSGDCEDKAIWLFARLKQCGYTNVRLVIGKYRQIDKRYHVWVTCSDASGNTCLLDPASQKRIWTEQSFGSGFYTPIYAFDGERRYRY